MREIYKQNITSINRLSAWLVSILTNRYGLYAHYTPKTYIDQLEIKSTYKGDKTKTIDLNLPLAPPLAKEIMQKRIWLKYIFNYDTIESVIDSLALSFAFCFFPELPGLCWDMDTTYLLPSHHVSKKEKQKIQKYKKSQQKQLLSIRSDNNRFNGSILSSH